ncbi:hypothetical protein [Paenibacillus campinasensis]|uniref:DNA modification methylase n=1 Tax=Paenibacillus campinasensis TaxID=66347 RepID=A0A268EI74_9BACL|nr:hypothetical protein [Paenibacillus campinasensis]PAD72838.1 hypothetical protein CHH67_21255 [Paenibacillus campinasensis]
MEIRGFNDAFGELTTLISVPNRDRYGNAQYRGNYAGDVLAKLISYLQRTGIQSPYVYDPMEGGKTSRDVCSYLGIPYVGDDIHNGFDVVNDDFHDVGFDLTVLHYPYWNMIDYAADLPKHLQSLDMSRMDWKTFIAAVSHVNQKAAAHSRYVAVLVGDMVVKGKGYIKSIQREMSWVGAPVRHFTKVQHNAMSYRRNYRGNFIPIVTEHLILFKTDYKPGGQLWILAPGQYKQISTDQYITWRNAVKHVTKNLENITPQAVFEAVKERFPIKLKNTNTPEATVRRTLQELEAEGFLRRRVRGYYERAV